jgi:APA family basic amino acid/polyamine antiporter
VQAWLTWIKLAAVGLIVGLGAWLGRGEPAHFVGSAAAGGDAPGAFLLAMAAALFAYGGWHIATYSAEETVDPARTIPRALIQGTIIVTAAYLAMNAVYLYVLPLDEVSASTRVAADLADRLLGKGGGAVMSVIAMFSAVGGLAGAILGGPRIYFAMARAGELFSALGAIHPRYGTPHRAIVLQAVWASALVATGSFRALFTRVVYTEWFFLALMAVALMRLRWRPLPGYRRAYTMPGFPVLPGLFIIVSVAVALNALRRNPVDGAVGLSIVLAGIPLYFARRRMRPASEPLT